MYASWVIYDCNWWDADNYNHHFVYGSIKYPSGLKCNDSIWMIPGTFEYDD